MVGEARPVTLTGPGGIGKTRLAVAVGERLRDRFGVGMAFVPLAAVTDPGLLLGSVALAGAADGLRRRAGLRTWPILRQGETQLAHQVRQAVGDDRFSQAFAAGSRLSQQEAVAAARHRPGDRIPGVVNPNS